MNGQDITLPGGHGQPPLIEKNGQPCALDETIKNQDRISVQKGEDGSSPEVTIGELVDTSSSKQITVDEEPYLLTPRVYRNNQQSTLDEIIQDRDSIRIEVTDTLLDVLTTLGYEKWLENTKPYRISINGKDTFFPSYCGKLFINSIEAKLSTKIQHGDVISFKPGFTPTVKELLAKKQLFPETTITISFNGEEVHLKKEGNRISRNGIRLAMDDRLYSGDSIEIEEQQVSAFIFQDLFNSVEINMPSHANGSFVLLKNGEETTFYEEIQQGDELEIVWPQATR